MNQAYITVGVNYLVISVINYIFFVIVFVIKYCQIPVIVIVNDVTIIVTTCNYTSRGYNFANFYTAKVEVYISTSL